VIQAVKPFVSSEDIAKGARWSLDISKELEASKYGIICITKSNMSAPWINFEAGALSRAMEENYVTPFLFDLKPSDVEGPLGQFQYVINERGDILKMVAGLNARVDSDHRLDSDLLKRAFDQWWQHLEKALLDLEQDELRGSTAAKQQPRNPADILEEILELTRIQQRLLLSESDGVRHGLDAIRMEMRQLLASQGSTFLGPFGEPSKIQILNRLLNPESPPTNISLLWDSPRKNTGAGETDRAEAESPVRGEEQDK
jgi:hypothetical protein